MAPRKRRVINTKDPRVNSCHPEYLGASYSYKGVYYDHRGKELFDANTALTAEDREAQKKYWADREDDAQRARIAKAHADAGGEGPPVSQPKSPPPPSVPVVDQPTAQETGAPAETPTPPPQPPPPVEEPGEPPAGPPAVEPEAGEEVVDIEGPVGEREPAVVSEEGDSGPFIEDGQSPEDQAGTVNLRAWALGTEKHLFKDVREEIKTTYNHHVGKISEAIDFLVEEGIITEEEADQARNGR